MIAIGYFTESGNAIFGLGVQHPAFPSHIEPVNPSDSVRSFMFYLGAEGDFSLFDEQMDHIGPLVDYFFPDAW